MRNLRERGTRKVLQVYVVSMGEQDRHINLEVVVQGFYFHARTTNKSRGDPPNAGIEPKSTRFHGRFEGRAHFPGKVAPLIIICRSDCRDRIVHSINHDTASRDKAERKQSRRANFL